MVSSSIVQQLVLSSSCDVYTISSSSNVVLTVSVYVYVCACVSAFVSLNVYVCKSHAACGCLKNAYNLP